MRWANCSISDRWLGARKVSATRSLYLRTKDLLGVDKCNWLTVVFSTHNEPAGAPRTTPVPCAYPLQSFNAARSEPSIQGNSV